MAFDNVIYLGLGVAVAVYLMFKLLTNKDRGSQEYEKIYNKILTSEEYKVKGPAREIDFAIIC